MASIATISKVADSSGNVITTVYAGDIVYVHFTPQSKSHTYFCRISMNGNTADGTPITCSDLSKSYYVRSKTIPESWLDGASSDVLKVGLITDDANGKFIGSNYTEITVLKEGYTPSGPTITYHSITYSSIGNSTLDAWNESSSTPVFVKNYSKANIQIGCDTSTVKSVSWGIENVSSNPTWYSSSIVFQTDILTTSGTAYGNITLHGTSGSSTTTTIYYNVHDYFPPSVSSMDVIRCNSSGTYDPEGTRLKCTYSINISSIGGRNGIDSSQSYISYRIKGASAWTTSTSISTTDGTVILPQTFDATNVYELRIVAYDSLGGSTWDSSSSTTAERMLNFAPYGNGLAVGQVSTVTSKDSEGKFEVGWDSEFSKTVTFQDLTYFNHRAHFGNGLTAESLYSYGTCIASSFNEPGYGMNLIKGDITEAGPNIVIGDTSTNSVTIYATMDQFIQFGTADHKVAGLMLNGERIDLSGGSGSTNNILQDYTLSSSTGFGQGARLITFKNGDGNYSAATAEYVQNYCKNYTAANCAISTSGLTPNYTTSSTDGYGRGAKLIQFKGETNKDYTGATPEYVQNYCNNYTDENFARKKHTHTDASTTHGHNSSSITPVYTTSNKYFIQLKGVSENDYQATTAAWVKYYTGSTYSLSGHSHSGYASTSHSHSGYAISGHTHPGYASSSHSHSSGDISCSTRSSSVATSDILIFSNKEGATPTYVQEYVKSKTGSDIRLKSNITLSTTNSLDIINHMTIKEFDWISGMRAGCHWDVGVIADELEELDTRFVFAPSTEDEDPSQIEYKSVDTWYLTGHILKAIQQLSEKIDALEAKINNA